MPDESCRKCGGLLLEFTKCAKCKATVQFICRICSHKTIERIHDNLCFKIDVIEFSNNEELLSKVHVKKY